MKETNEELTRLKGKLKLSDYSLQPIKSGKIQFLLFDLKFVYIDSESATFVQGDVGINSCPEGYETITEPSTCETASKSLGLTYRAQFNTGGVNAICNWCGGCSTQDTRVSNGHGPHARWICKLRGTYLPCFVQENSILLRFDDL